MFHIRIYSNQQSNCNILLPKSFLGLSNLSKCHLHFCQNFTAPILGYTLKSSIPYSKVLPLNLCSRENKLVPKWLCRTQGVMSVTEIGNRMFTSFAFSLYNMPFFIPLYLHKFCSIRDTNLKFSDRTCLWYCNYMTLTIYISYRFENASMG